MEPTLVMNRAPAIRGFSLAAFRLLAVAVVGGGGGAAGLLAGGCSLNTSGITDPGPPGSDRGIGGDTTSIETGSGGTTDAGLGGVGGASTGGLGGSSGGAGGAPNPGGAGGSGVVGTGGVVAGTGGRIISGVGGVTGTGGAGVGGMMGTGGRGVGGMGTGGRGVGGMGTGGMGVGGMGTGGSIVVNGCADGTREAFTNIQRFPSIAGCSGGWSIAGVVTPASSTAMCARAAGNDGARPNGNGCTVEDLCAAGWHVCLGANELDALNVTCAQAQLPPVGGAAGAGVLFFATRQRMQGNVCNADDTNGTNDIHGCGNFGLAEDPDCAPLDRHLSHTECDQAPPWDCGNNNPGTTEALLVIKPGSAAGGVLCCH
ncbi:MAG TPA: hypothetical protein VFH68_19555 [Polyangia bacterium]|nr:hypothetical protein [Polyangia bacterium]